MKVGVWMAIVTAVSWAVLAIILKFTLKFFSPGTVVWGRMTLAFLFMLGFYAIRNPQGLRILRRPPLIGLLAGAFIATNYFCFLKGLQLTGAGNAQIMIQLA